ncbi:MAG: hypothetical protein JO314_10840 [Acidobacteria bacterium]|nr:hypothetical protein [Acidobacteriota bacterium]
MKFVFLAALGALLFLPTKTLCQRDYFTPEEIELIRDAQRIDQRIDVLTHAVDRRFAALNVDVKAPPFKEEKDKTWGVAPTGSRLELLIDVKSILQKAIDDIDNLSERPSSMPIEEPDPNVKPKKNEKKPPGFAELFPIAVRSLAAAAERYGPALKIELDKSKDPSEKGAIMDSLEMCDEIVASVAKLPAGPATPADPKKNKN